MTDNSWLTRMDKTRERTAEIQNRIDQLKVKLRWIDADLEDHALATLQILAKCLERDQSVMQMVLIAIEPLARHDMDAALRQADLQLTHARELLEAFPRKMQ